MLEEYGIVESDVDRIKTLYRAHNSAVECHLHTVEVVGSNPAVPTKIRFRDIRRHPVKNDKPLRNQRFLCFYVQRRIVEAMLPWGYRWG